MRRRAWLGAGAARCAWECAGVRSAACVRMCAGVCAGMCAGVRLTSTRLRPFACPGFEFRSPRVSPPMISPLLNQYRHAPARCPGTPGCNQALREGVSILAYRRKDFDQRVFLRCVALGDRWRDGRLSCAAKPPDRGLAIAGASLRLLLRGVNAAAECAKMQHFDVFPAIRLMQGAKISRTQSQCRRPSRARRPVVEAMPSFPVPRLQDPLKPKGERRFYACFGFSCIDVRFTFPYCNRRTGVFRR